MLWKLQDVMVGDDAASIRQALDIKYPVENGIIRDWDDMEKLWDYTFHDKLGVDTRGKKIILTEAPLNPVANRRKMVERMFEKYQFDGVNISVQAMLTLYAQGMRRIRSLFVGSRRSELSTH